MLSSDKAWASAGSTTSSECMHGRNILHVERLFPGFTEDTSEQAALSAGQSGIGYERSVDVARPTHLGALIAARILNMIRHAATASILPEQRLLVRLATLVGTASATFFVALDDPENLTTKSYLQKAAQAAEESWQQAVKGYNGPTITNPTVPDIEQSAHSSQHDDDSEPTFAPLRKNQPQLQAQLSRLSDRTRLRRFKKKTLHTKGAWQRVTRIEDLCHSQVSHKWLYHSDACAGSVLTSHDYTNAQKDWAVGATQALANAVCVDHSWTLNSSMVKPAAPLKPPEGTMLAYTPFWEDQDLQIQGSPRNPEDSQKHNPGAG